MVFQIFVLGVNGKTGVYDEDKGITENSTVLQLKQAIEKQDGIPVAELRLVFGTKEITNQDALTLEEVDLQNKSTVFVILRLKGGAEINVKIELHNSNKINVTISLKSTILQLKEQIEQENSTLSASQMCLSFASVKLEDQKKVEEYKIDEGDVIIQSKSDLSTIEGLIISYEPDIMGLDYSEEARAKMPCGHVISRDSMTQFLKSLIEAKKYVIKCPGRKRDGTFCEIEWPYPLCRDVGVLSQEEQEEFEIGFEREYVKQLIGAQECPVCKSFVIKENNVGNRVRCPSCAKKKQGYDFCWKCLKQWKNESHSKNIEECGNLDCGSIEYKNTELMTCGAKEIYGAQGVPEIRSCPSCKALIQHIENCKHMKCKCGIDFCFVCLSIKLQQGWPCGSPFSKCKVASRQQI